MLELYPENLEKEIVRYKNYIPRKLRNKEHLKLYAKYYTDEYGIFKVINIEKIYGIEYYYIVYRNQFQAVITYPISRESRCFQLLKNYNKLEKENIINKSKEYTGAEIKFWFTANNINFKDDNFSGFEKYFSKNNTKIKDSSKYKLRRNKKKKEYEIILK